MLYCTVLKWVSEREGRGQNEVCIEQDNRPEKHRTEKNRTRKNAAGLYGQRERGGEGGREGCGCVLFI